MNAPRAALRDLALLLCALAASWPLVELTRSGAVLLPSAVVICVIVAAGAVCRLRPLPGLMTLGLQVVVAVAAAGAALAVCGISPSPANLRHLGSELGTTIQNSTTPLPDKPEVVAMVIIAAALVALVVDYIGGTARMCLFVAVPIAAPFVLTATATGRVLDVRYFVVAAVCWAFLVLTQSTPGRRRVQWSGRALIAFGAMAAVAVLVSLLITPAVPQRAAPALSEAGSSGIDTSINFSESLDLRKSLHSTNPAPVLQYDTNAAEPPPLRVTTSSAYSNGVWQATASRGPFTSVKQQTTLPAPGLSSSAPTTQVQTSVTINGLQPPLVAAPAPLKAANFGTGNESFKIVTSSGVPVLTKRTPAYAVLSREFTAAAKPSNDTTVTTSTPSVTAADLDVDAVPAEARKRLEPMLSQASSATTHFDKAIAIQHYLRTSGGFTYSLDAPSASENGKDLDPLSAFLTVKKGYCTQFATAMIMAARAEGIPARMAIGFLPGDVVEGHRQVHASDAHAWPELYFPGMGWTRFDPTPASRSGAAPAYAPDAAPESASPSSTPSTTSESSTSTPTSMRPTPSASSTTSVTQTHDDGLPTWVRALLTTLAVLAGLALVASILPLAGRAERGRLLRHATSDAERDEGHWHAMWWSLRDLGLSLESGRSPRETLTRFRQGREGISPNLDEALERAVSSVESSRYAQNPSRSVDTSTARVVTAARDDAGLPTKLRAWLFPASGREFFKRLFRRG